MHTRLTASTIGWIALAMALTTLADAQITQVSLWPFYIAPVVAASRLGEFRHGAVTAAVSVLLLFVAAHFAGHPYENDLYFLIASTSKLGALLVIAWLANRLAATQALLLRILGPEQSASIR